MKQLPPRWNSLVGLLALASMLGCQGISSVNQASSSAGRNTTGQLLVTPSSFSFEIKLGNNQTQPVTIANSGAASLTVTGVTASGAGFSVSGLNPPLLLAPGQHYTFGVTFRPLTIGKQAGNISLVSDASNPNQTVPLKGMGVPGSLGQLTIAPTNIDFGNVFVGTNAQLNGTLSASGATVIVSSDQLNGSAFTISGFSSFPFTIPAGQQVPFTVTFTPSETGVASGGISFVSNALNSPTMESLSGRGTDTGTGIQPQFFGMHEHFHPGAPWPGFATGAFRIWNTGLTRWHDVAANCTASEAADPYNSCYDWTDLDSRLATLKSRGITEVVYTMSGVPNWADPNDWNGCDEGACHLPSDINADGTGSNATWKDWVTAVAEHVNNAAYLQSHARVTAWEPWNEWWRNPVVTENGGHLYTSISINATYAQMVRLAEDARCIIKGVGAVNGTPCTSVAIDPIANILTPSTGGNGIPASVMRNFLYCNDQPKAGSYCTWSVSDPRGANTADVINSHFYQAGSDPENIATDIAGFRAFMQPAELAKPLWSDETAMNQNDFVGPPRIENAQAAFVARLYLVASSAGMDELYWYAFDDAFARAFWLEGSGETLGAQAYGQTYNWLVGAAVASKCSTATYGGTVWSCQLTRQSGYQAEAIWDTAEQYACNIDCPTHNLTVPAIYLHYRDLTGNVISISNNTVPVGAKAILLENQ
jgi:Abnormal spindle-like microcephaly-assoc'd, ASPM-SPD-2-Hydin